MNTFKGTMPALVTPLNADNSINVAVLNKLLDYLMGLNANGFYIGGATGEGICLKAEQRKTLAQQAIETVNHKVPCIIHIASVNFDESIELAKHAEKCGADAVSAIPPLFYTYTADEVYNYYKKIAESVHIPVMVYFNPSAGFQIDAKIAAHLFEIDNVTSIKWTNSDFYEMIRLKDITHGEMCIMNGCDQMLLMGLNAGADGGIGTTYNFLYPEISSVYNCFIDKNIEKAQKEQNKINRIIEVLQKYGVVPATKLILEKRNFAVGNAVFPMKTFNESEKSIIMEEFKNAGLE